MMLGIGLGVHGLALSLGIALVWLLPIVYGLIMGLGLVTFLDQSPFSWLAQTKLAQGFGSIAISPTSAADLQSNSQTNPQANSQPHSQLNPWVQAYCYGLLLGPMTLPCTGPIITSALLLSLNSPGSLPAQLAQELLYFFAFSLGFGWPLLLIPCLAVPVQRRWLGQLRRHHRLLQRISGSLLVVIGAYGMWTEWLPNL
jgi:cytochrome c-type biogenesis protein